MGEEDIRRQQPNVQSMRLLGAEVRPVTSGSRTLRDAINEAMRDWMSSVETTHYILGSVVGPHPFPRDRPRLSIGHRPRDDRAVPAQIGRLPDLVVACVGGGSNAAGMFYPFVDRSRRAAGRRRGRRPQRQAGRPRLAPVVRPARRAARQLQLRHAGRRRPDLRRPLRLGRPRLSGRRPRAQLLERDWPGDVHRLPRRRGAGRLSTPWPAPKASCRPWKARTPSPKPCELARGRRQGRRRSSSASPAAATRTPPRSPA